MGAPIPRQWHHGPNGQGETSAFFSSGRGNPMKQGFRNCRKTSQISLQKLRNRTKSMKNGTSEAFGPPCGQKWPRGVKKTQKRHKLSKHPPRFGTHFRYFSVLCGRFFLSFFETLLWRVFWQFWAQKYPFLAPYRVLVSYQLIWVMLKCTNSLLESTHIWFT